MRHTNIKKNCKIAIAIEWNTPDSRCSDSQFNAISPKPYSSLCRRSEMETTKVLPRADGRAPRRKDLEMRKKHGSAAEIERPIPGCGATGTAR